MNEYLSPQDLKMVSVTFIPKEQAPAWEHALPETFVLHLEDSAHGMVSVALTRAELAAVADVCQSAMLEAAMSEFASSASVWAEVPSDNEAVNVEHVNTQRHSVRKGETQNA